MSKPMTRVLFAVLISLIIVAGVYTGVRGASLHAGMAVGKTHVTAGLLPDLSHTRQAALITHYYSTGLDASSNNQFHDCHSDSTTDPGD